MNADCGETVFFSMESTNWWIVFPQFRQRNSIKQNKGFYALLLFHGIKHLNVLCIFFVFCTLGKNLSTWLCYWSSIFLLRTNFCVEIFKRDCLKHSETFCRASIFSANLITLSILSSIQDIKSFTAEQGSTYCFQKHQNPVSRLFRCWAMQLQAITFDAKFNATNWIRQFSFHRTQKYASEQSSLQNNLSPVSWFVAYALFEILLFKYSWRRKCFTPRRSLRILSVPGELRSSIVTLLFLESESFVKTLKCYNKTSSTKFSSRSWNRAGGHLSCTVTWCSRVS